MAATLQTLPRTASRYSAAQLATIAEAERQVAARWARTGTQFDSSWLLVGSAIVATVLDAQTDIAERANDFIPAILRATSQAAEAAEQPDPLGFVGYTGAGLLVERALSSAPIRAKQAVAGGQTAIQAAATAQRWLRQATATILADTARGAEGLSSYTRPDVTGYVRMVHGGACGRCVILAGRRYRMREAFDRHPDCRCSHIPATEDLAGDWQTAPHAYFDSLTDEQQIKLMGSKANAQAVRDGADLTQIINAYRRTGGLSKAQSPIKRRNGAKFTTEGTTRRGLAGQQQAGLRRHGPRQMRLMPETIAERAKDTEDRLRLLRLYGWIADEPARARGRDILAEQRRAERNERARERRRERRAS
jgi:hypothetical protein